jgi:hypothetical protein
MVVEGIEGVVFSGVELRRVASYTRPVCLLSKGAACGLAGQRKSGLALDVAVTRARR